LDVALTFTGKGDDPNANQTKRDQNEQKISRCAHERRKESEKASGR